jgi:hypothetical protein
LCTQEGNILRVEMVDDAGTRYSTDISTSMEVAGGLVQVRAPAE